jgi:Cyclin, N-terminal domain
MYMQAEHVCADELTRGVSSTQHDQLMTYFCEMIFKMIAALRGMRLRVASTACTYFHRFFSRCSLAQHDPRVVTVACVYMASAPLDSCLSVQCSLVVAGCSHGGIANALHQQQHHNVHIIQSSYVTMRPCTIHDCSQGGREQYTESKGVHSVGFRAPAITDTRRLQHKDAAGH